MGFSFFAGGRQVLSADDSSESEDSGEPDEPGLPASDTPSPIDPEKVTKPDRTNGDNKKTVRLPNEMPKPMSMKLVEFRSRVSNHEHGPTSRDASVTDDDVGPVIPPFSAEVSIDDMREMFPGRNDQQSCVAWMMITSNACRLR